MNSSSTPTVVLVHGAFADASSWGRVITQLQAAGLDALAVANPLRGLAADGDYIASLVSQIEGDVVLVGHSYGGPVITHAASRADNVQALVFVASFGLDQGQSIPASLAGFPEPLLNTSMTPRNYPVGAGGSAPELYIEKDKFAAVFAADLPAEQLAVLAVSQRPLSAPGFVEPLTVEPAWRTLPSWFLVTSQDNAIDPASQRAAAERMGATIVEVPASHAVALSQPVAVAGVILDAVAAIRTLAPVN